MATTISGKLINGIGEPIKNCKITLKSISTSTTVIAHTTASQTPSAAGDYSLSVEPGKYKVTLCVDGFPPEYVGDIQVYKDSPNGTLNYFLGLPQDNDLRPDAIKHFEAMVDKVASQVAEVEKSKLAAESSARSAAASADRASQITGLSTVTDAISMASVPLPDVWIPFNDGLQMITGYGEEVKVGGVTVAKMVSFSRATTATYIDKSGVLRTAGVNEPRLENDGLFLEWQSTNICHASSVTMTHWTKNSTPIIEPMGFYTKITPNAPGSGAYITPGTKLVIGNKYTFSFWAYSSSATCKVGIGVEKEYKSISQITNVKNRYSVTFVATQQSPTIVAYGGYDGFINEPGAFYIGGVQLEELPFASSLIQTSGAQVTRAPDLIGIPTFLNAMVSRIPITISANVTSKMTGISTYPRLLNLNKNENRGPYIDGIKNSWGGIVLSGTSSLSVRWSDRAYFVNGVKGSTFDDYDGEPIETSNILSDLSAPARGFFGNVRDFKIWHLSLTDEQIKAIR